jgi:hypothetical protein
VLSFYGALARGDLQRATSLLGDDLQASRAASLPIDPAAMPRALRVEELRFVDDDFSQRPRPSSERVLSVRVSVDDPTDEPPEHRRTVAGTWRAQQVGEEWRLVRPGLHETADLAAIADALPTGATVVETAGGDLRGRGLEDLIVLASGPGRNADLEPWGVFAGPAGLEPGVPLGSFVPGGRSIGGPGGTVSIGDVNADGTLEVTDGGFVGAHASLLWVLRWDGSTLAPLFAEASNSPTVGLADLDDDGVAEIVLGQSGYCGGYADSPRLAFAFRWQDGAYRSASFRYPSLNDGIDEHAARILASTRDDDARACIQHMLATANALRGRPADARAAYRAYAGLRQQTPADAQRSARPVYVEARYVEDDLRAALSAAESGASPGRGPAELATFHDLLGDVLIERARSLQYEGERTAERGNAEAARDARRKASEARQAATQEYRAALALDPSDEEAKRNVGE